MSVRNGMLALLAEKPMHGYQLRQEFERRTGSTWPLNIGQVYTTLHRLVRDGLAEPVPVQGAGTGDDVERFRLTDAGAAEVAAWWAQPVHRGVPAPCTGTGSARPSRTSLCSVVYTWPM